MVLRTLPKNQLQEIAASRGLIKSGKKAEIIDRILGSQSE
ncbi:MAG: hypothetical protein GY749_35595 [Desulfobacteraceae bacterium]|nr:hypothetical protein [Desulfobacteraceae bacterium]